MKMDNMTLREVCGAFGVSRRAVQGYEKAGLLSPSGRSERGHLLYDGKAQERIRQIKLFQQIGFSLKEIGDVIDAPLAFRKEALMKQLERLREEEKSIEILIAKVHRMLERN